MEKETITRSSRDSNRKLWSPGVRWKPWEISIYIIITIIQYSYVLINVSIISQSRVEEVEGLSPSYWIPSIKQDNSDSQWKNIRSGLPILCVLASCHVLIGWAVRRACETNQLPTPDMTQITASPRSAPPSSPISITPSSVDLSQSPLSPNQPSQYSPSRNQNKLSQNQNTLSQDESQNEQLPPLNTRSGSTEEEKRCGGSNGPSFYVCVVNIVIGSALLLFLHESGAIFSLTFLVLNYSIVSLLLAPTDSPQWDSWKRRVCFPVYTWGFCVGILFANEYFDGYRFGWISPSLAWLDRHQGSYSWTGPFNFVTLRLISFNFDYLWAVERRPSPRRAPAQRQLPTDASLGGRESNVSGKVSSREFNIQGLVTSMETTSASSQLSDLSHYLHRQESHQPLQAYSFTRFFAYMLYPPLYLAGPISSFNAWSSQISAPQTVCRGKRLTAYAFQWFKNLVMMEIFTHLAYPTAILTRSPQLWSTLTNSQVGMLSLFSLFHIWMKLMLTWRFARLWALSDGVDVPENMTRCVFNNFSMEVFWQCWHRSFNQWILRYVYFPLGGSRVSLVRRVANMALVFTYVAIWHDINLKLLSWCWLICLAFGPELALRHVFRHGQFPKLKSRVLFRYLLTFATTLNGFMMAFANLIGFSFGLVGMNSLISSSTRWDLFVLVLTSLAFLYSPQNVSVWIETQRDGVMDDGQGEKGSKEEAQEMITL